MGLHIEGEEAGRLAAELAVATGESVSRAVTIALKERLARLERPGPLAEDLLAIGRDCASRISEPHRTIEHGELLYDERGLPR